METQPETPRFGGRLIEIAGRTSWEPVTKPREGFGVVPNLADCDAESAASTWETARFDLDRKPVSE